MNRQRKGILAGVATALIATLVFIGCDAVNDALTGSGDTTYNYICANGTPVSGTTTTENTERCQSCASGYTLSGNAGADGTTCVADTAARYTCENGTPVDGTPSGTSNVEECKACTTGFALSAEKKCVQDSTAPTFTVGPAVKADSTGATSVTVTLTASEVGKIFWVLYTDGSAVADAAALINDATIDTAPTAVVARSATAQVESTTDAVEIALTGLTKSTPYDFYAVLQDSAGNNGVLSAKVEITTVDTARYTCENGTPVSGSPGGRSDVERCMSCASGYTLSGSAGADGTTCTDNPPTFSVAPMVDSSTETGATVTLTASEAGTLFWVLYADNAITTAPSAAALIAAASGSSVGEQRSGDTVTVDAANEKTVTLTGLAPGTTYDFYAVLQDSAGNNGAVSAKVEITTAAAATAKYTCENGTAKTGTPSGTSDVGACQSCATGYTLSGAAGVDGTTCTDNPPTFSVAPMVDSSTETGATVTLTASEAGKLYWVLYADNAITTAPSAAALIAAASGGSVGEQRSGANEAVTTAEKTVTIAGLTAGITYNFYAVLQDSAGNKGALSAKVVITTAAAADKTPPTFIDGPQIDGDPTATGATVKLTASEAGKLFWVLYADGANAPADAATLIAAASGSSVGEQRSGDTVTVDAANEKTVTLTGLTAGTTYDFYAVLQDSAGNNGAVSPKLDIATTTVYTCTDGTAKTGSPGGSTNMVACQSCSSGFKLMAPSNGTIGDVGTTCVDTVYTCSNGTPATGHPAGNSNMEKCKSCTPPLYTLHNETCIQTKYYYTCANGTKADGTTYTTNTEKCKSCDNNYHLVHSQCTNELGSFCIFQGDCTSNLLFCRNFKCTARGAEGDSCPTQSQPDPRKSTGCLDGLYCDTYNTDTTSNTLDPGSLTCKRLLPTGTTCYGVNLIILGGKGVGAYCTSGECGTDNTCT